jgi:hypothetical protein
MYINEPGFIEATKNPDFWKYVDSLSKYEAYDPSVRWPSKVLPDKCPHALQPGDFLVHSRGTSMYVWGYNSATDQYHLVTTRRLIYGWEKGYKDVLLRNKTAVPYSHQYIFCDYKLDPQTMAYKLIYGGKKNEETVHL